MKSIFFNLQNEEKKEAYIKLLTALASFSNLFTESDCPYLYYRAMENIFCKAFEAKNLSRGDISVDASLNGVGIGLKTFLQNNGKTYQKVAEFNKESYLLRGLDEKTLIKRVSNMRNERIKATKRICQLNEMIYHSVTRENNFMGIYEEPMDLINLDLINIDKKNNNTIHFTDELNEYSYSLSKNTLLKKFITNKQEMIYGFDVKILDDPYEILLTLTDNHEFYKLYNKENKKDEYIILPLYSPKSMSVPEFSGLNQWNAHGRARNQDEVYIPIPSWIHKKKKGFFKYSTDDNRTEPFNVLLPNKSVISMRIVQQGGKALMSNPNSELGKWILRDILKLEPRRLVTKEQLDIIGIDSLKLSKIKDELYELNFMKIGSYEVFEKSCMNKF